MPTTSTTEPMVPPEPSPGPVPGPSVPTLEELERLAPGESRVFQGVDWDFYEGLRGVIGERPWFRTAYDGRDVEIMPVSHLHEDDAEFAGALVEVLAEERNVPCRSLGSSTWRSPAVRRGIEADQSFYLTAEKVAAAVSARARRSREADDYPSPDLVIEVDHSQPKVDRAGIYAALRVAEIWRLVGQGVVIERLGDDGRYLASDASGFLSVRADEVARWVFREDVGDVGEWKRRLRAWVRAELSKR